MRVAIVENAEVTHHGQVGIALHEAAAVVRIFRPFAGDALPEVGEFDALVAFGGAQAATDDADHPWLPALAERMRAFSEADRAVLGICLGAQVLARGFGAANHIGTAPEFGWCAVEATDAGREDPFFAGLEPGFRIMQLHSDTFDLPPGAVRLAGSVAVPAQAFRLGRATYGTQFHFEASRRVVADWDRKFGAVIERMTPDWPELYPQMERDHGAAADAAGLRLARNWVALI